MTFPDDRTLIYLAIFYLKLIMSLLYFPSTKIWFCRKIFCVDRCHISNILGMILNCIWISGALKGVEMPVV